jgi:hypothetical protein
LVEDPELLGHINGGQEHDQDIAQCGVGRTAFLGIRDGITPVVGATDG